MEDWMRISGFQQYAISTAGRVQNWMTERLLVLSPNQTGTTMVGLMYRGIQHQRSVPKLVLEHFMQHPNANFDTPINLNGDRSNNSIENLAARPRQFAVKYNRQFTDPTSGPILAPLLDLESEIVYANSWDCATANGLLESDVVQSILNNTVTWPTYQRFEILEGILTDSHPIRGM